MTRWRDEFSMSGTPRRLGATLHVDGRVVAMVGPVGAGYGGYIMATDETRTFGSEEFARRWVESQALAPGEEVNATWGRSSAAS